MNFLKEKNSQLLKNDLSKKGSIDSRINELVHFINSLKSYFTTSSCSGRTIVFIDSETTKKGCKWIFVSHDIVAPDAVIDSLDSHCGSAILKFEPFVLHTQCETIEDARKMLQVGIQAGFKNSGISVGKSGKIIVAIRNTLSLEVPLSSEGTLLVSIEYISFVVNKCNEKMLNNWKRIERFSTNLQSINDSKARCISKDVLIKKSDQSVNRISDNKPEEVEELDVYESFSNLLKDTHD